MPARLCGSPAAGAVALPWLAAPGVAAAVAVGVAGAAASDALRVTCSAAMSHASLFELWMLITLWRLGMFQSCGSRVSRAADTSAERQPTYPKLDCAVPRASHELGLHGAM
jgi:hypothetical protein